MEEEDKNENADPGIRQHLVDTAVGFLNMEKILRQPENIKRQFLDKKGLTSREIDTAFSLAKTVVPFPKANRDAPYGAELIQSPDRVLYLPPQSSFWTRLRDVTNAIVFLSGIVIGVKYLYKHYVGPFLTGRKPESKDDLVVQVQKSVMEVLQQIEVTLQKINKNILDQNKKADNQLMQPSGASSEEVKRELSIIKGLLINKKSFPAPPPLAPSIPQWQKQVSNTQTHCQSTQSSDLEMNLANADEQAVVNGTQLDEVKKTEHLNEASDTATVSTERLKV